MVKLHKRRLGGYCLAGPSLHVHGDAGSLPMLLDWRDALDTGTVSERCLAPGVAVERCVVAVLGVGENGHKAAVQ